MLGVLRYEAGGIKYAGGIRKVMRLGVLSMLWV